MDGWCRKEECGANRRTVYLRHVPAPRDPSRRRPAGTRAHLNGAVDADNVHFAVNDATFGSGRAVALLAAMGNVRIARLSGPLTLSAGLPRHRGFVRAMKKGGLRAEPKRIGMYGGFTESEGR